MRKETEAVRTHYSADPRKEWDAWYGCALRFCEKRDCLTHSEHLTIVSKKER